MSLLGGQTGLESVGSARGAIQGPEGLGFALFSLTVIEDVCDVVKDVVGAILICRLGVWQFGTFPGKRVRSS